MDRSNVEIVRPLRIRGYRADRGAFGKALNLCPGLSIVSRNDDTGGRCSDPDGPGNQRRCVNNEHVFIQPVSERKLLPALVDIVRSIKTIVGPGEDSVLVVFGKSEK